MLLGHSGASCRGIMPITAQSRPRGLTGCPGLWRCAASTPLRFATTSVYEVTRCPCSAQFVHDTAPASKCSDRDRPDCMMSMTWTRSAPATAPVPQHSTAYGKRMLWILCTPRMLFCLVCDPRTACALLLQDVAGVSPAQLPDDRWQVARSEVAAGQKEQPSGAAPLAHPCRCLCTEGRRLRQTNTA